MTDNTQRQHRISPAYVLAEHLHDTFTGTNNILEPSEISDAGVGSGRRGNKTEQVRIDGYVNGRPAYEVLSLDFPRSTYYLSRVYVDYGGPHIQDRFPLDAGLDKLEVLANSMFMEALVAIEMVRGADHSEPA